MAWTEPKYSGTRRTKAGVALVSGQETVEDLQVIDNWRSSHSAPLQMIKMLLKTRAKSVDHDAIVAQRLKRLPSIRAKLKRETMRLQQMQDLGGCRAILSDMSVLRKLVKKFEEGEKKNPKGPELRRHEIVDRKDYIANPKKDGYRSVHYVFAYRTTTPHLSCFVGHLIEVQIRTQLQHAWATAVEIVDSFTGQSLKTALKTKIGDTNWRRFFAVMGSVLAFREKTPLVPDMPVQKRELTKELRILAKRTDVENVLSGLQTAVRMIGEEPGEAAAYVLQLNAQEKSISVSAFTTLVEAEQFFFQLEKNTANNPSIQVVQVSVERMEALRTAYPNYYLDTTVFLQALRKAIA